MRHYRLTNQERAATGFTDAYALDHKDLTATSGTTQTIVLETLGANQNILYSDAALIVNEAFSGDGVTNCQVKVGHDALNGGSADDDYFISNSAVTILNTFLGGATGSTSTNLTAAATVDITFTVAGTGKNPDDVTAGSLVVYLKVIRQNDFIPSQG